MGERGGETRREEEPGQIESGLLGSMLACGQGIIPFRCKEALDRIG
jgi:hypothetical protein